MTAPTLTSSQIILRAPKPNDIEDLLALGRDPEITRMYGGSREQPPLTREEISEDIEEWFSNSHAWIIEHNGKCIGNIRLHTIDMKDRRARLAVGISNPAMLGLGLGSEAIRSVLIYGFNQLGLHRIDLRVLEFNTRAIAAYEKCGFKIEGRKRESALIDDRWHDDIIMGILASEFIYKSA